MVRNWIGRWLGMERVVSDARALAERVDALERERGALRAEIAEICEVQRKTVTARDVIHAHTEPEDWDAVLQRSLEDLQKESK